MVTIYTTKTCAFCQAAKDYLAKSNVSFQEVKVDEVAQGIQHLMEKSGQLGVPVIDIDGKIIIGFNRQELDNALREKSLIT